MHIVHCQLQPDTREHAEYHLIQLGTTLHGCCTLSRMPCCGLTLTLYADLRRQWLEKGKERAQLRAVRREAAFVRQERFVEKARQARELRVAAQQAKYGKKLARLLATKV